MHAFRASIVALALVAPAALGFLCFEEVDPDPGELVTLPGLTAPVRLIVDRFGVPHLYGERDADVVRAQGWLHARDRLWQMDLTRREVDGTLAELLGPDELGGDVQNRTIGLHRAAQRSLDALSAEERALLDAYVEGVNAWITAAEAGGFLPAQYAEVELTRVDPWTAVDTLAIGKGVAASLSLDIDAGRMEQLEAYVTAGQEADPPFDGLLLFTDDVRRVAPTDPVSTVPDATGGFPFLPGPSFDLDPEFLAKAARASRGFLERAGRSRLLAAAMSRPERFVGSNHWGVSGAVSTTGFPIIANDPHLSLNTPSTFYENHLVIADDPLLGPANVHGITFPGIPTVILGQNERITWGATTNPMDVSDLFLDRLVRDEIAPDCPTNFCLVSDGELHPIDLEIAEYRHNNPDNGVLDDVVVDFGVFVPFADRFILTAEFRSFGPLVFIEDPGLLLGTANETTGLFLQFTGFHATGELRTFRSWNRARNLDEFVAGLQEFDFGSQNWAFAGPRSEAAPDDYVLAYFASAENPLRADLEAGTVVGLPPFFVRDGSGPNNWIPDPARSQGQAIPYRVLPFEEMPQTVEPVNDFFANANNDPAGVSLDNDSLNQRRPGNPDAIYYLNPSFSDGLRAGRITRLLREKLDAGEKIGPDAMKAIQANVQQLDAELLLPFLLAAFENASAPGAPAELAALADDPEIAEAIGRLVVWDYSSPTGIPEGYDARDFRGERSDFVSDAEARASVAATLYNVWRAKAIRTVVDATLGRVNVPGVGSSDGLKSLFHLLSEEPYDGVGASGVDFVPEPAALSAAERRDLALLAALRTGLDALAGPDFAEAFGGSTNQDDYRWGRLHRITFDAELGGEFSVPPAAGFTDLAGDLPGIPRDGGYEVPNASSFNARADSSNAFRFGGGPVRRYVGVAGGGASALARVAGWNVIPGGSTADVDSPLYAIQLPTWLTADYHPTEMFEVEASRGALSRTTFQPVTLQP